MDFPFFRYFKNCKIQCILQAVCLVLIGNLYGCHASQQGGMSTGKSGSNGNFKLEYSLKAQDGIPVHRYKSEKTGLTVVVAEVQSPVVYGAFSLATEAFDDDGLPHTLEHLIFLGSKKYPYKGVLDLLANRCFASGTNAWTATDHTAYTLKTAGSEGFLSILPVYLDHILNPTLTESGFLTEVHHITEEGRDGGVVYSEMNGRQNGNTVNRAFLNAVYPGQCAYKSETGGILKNLRESTTNAKIKQYHKEFYRPENLAIIVSGPIKAEQIFTVLAPIEEELVKVKYEKPYVRPFQTACPPVSKAVDVEIKYPDSSEETGVVYVGWRTPSNTTEYKKLFALELLLNYLTNSSMSPLVKKFCEGTDKLANDVGNSWATHTSSHAMIIFYGVPVAKLKEVSGKLTAYLTSIANNVEKIDMKRMALIIQNKRVETLSSFENSPHDALTSDIIDAVLYGNTKEDLEMRLNETTQLNELNTKDAVFWKSLVKELLVDSPTVTVRGIPSIIEQTRLDNEDAARLKKNQDTLGASGLAKKGEELNNAVKKNDTPPPAEVLTSIKIPSIDSIQYLSVKRFTTDSPEQHPKFSLKNSPIYVHLDHLKSHFVTMSVYLDTFDLADQDRFYIPLLLNLLANSPIKRNGKIIPHEEVVRLIDEDTVYATASLGFDSSTFSCSSFCQTAFFFIQVEPEKFERGIEWIREILFQTELTEERVKSITSDLITSSADMSSSAQSVIGELLNDMLYKDNYNSYYISFHRQNQILTAIQTAMGKPEEAKKVMATLNRILKTITDVNDLEIRIACDVDLLTSKVKDPAASLNKLLLPGVSSAKKRIKSYSDHDFVNKPLGEDLSCVIGISSTDSSYLYEAAPSISNVKDKDLAAVIVYNQYLSQLEGPIWKRIRGKGLTYGCSLSEDEVSGFLYGSFYRAQDVSQGFKVLQDILKESLAVGYKWDQTLVDSAKSSAIYAVVLSENTLHDLRYQALILDFRDAGYDHNRIRVKEIQAVTIEDLKRVGEQYIKALVDMQRARIVIAADPANTKDIQTAFNGYGKKLLIHEKIEATSLSKINPAKLDELLKSNKK